jgi:hypothetical protein
MCIVLPNEENANGDSLINNTQIMSYSEGKYTYLFYSNMMQTKLSSYNGYPLSSPPIPTLLLFIPTKDTMSFLTTNSTYARTVFEKRFQSTFPPRRPTRGGSANSMNSIDSIDIKTTQTQHANIIILSNWKNNLDELLKILLDHKLVMEAPDLTEYKTMYPNDSIVLIKPKSITFSGICIRYINHSNLIRIPMLDSHETHSKRHSSISDSIPSWQHSIVVYTSNERIIGLNINKSYDLTEKLQRHMPSTSVKKNVMVDFIKEWSNVNVISCNIDKIWYPPLPDESKYDIKILAIEKQDNIPNCDLCF